MIPSIDFHLLQSSSRLVSPKLQQGSDNISRDLSPFIVARYLNVCAFHFDRTLISAPEPEDRFDKIDLLCLSVINQRQQ